MKLLPYRCKFCELYKTIHHYSLIRDHTRRRGCMCVNCDVPNAPLRQNDLNLLRASAVTRGSNGYRNKSQQKILLPFLLALESATVRSRLHIDLKRALSYSRDHQSGTLCHPVLKICKPSDASRESYIHNLVQAIRCLKRELHTQLSST